MIRLITFLNIDECYRRLEASFDQNYHDILEGESSAETSRSDKFYIGRTLTESQFEIQIVNPEVRQYGKIFFGTLQSFSTGTKVQGELQPRPAEKLFKIATVMMIFYMLLLSLRNLADNAGVIAGLVVILLVAFVLEYGSRKRRGRYEQPFVAYLEITLQAMSLESNQ